jgi:hypothetical protein
MPARRCIPEAVGGPSPPVIGRQPSVDRTFLPLNVPLKLRGWVLPNLEVTVATRRILLLRISRN